jgi:hypothetical protein
MLDPQGERCCFRLADSIEEACQLDLFQIHCLHQFNFEPVDLNEGACSIIFLFDSKLQLFPIL